MKITKRIISLLVSVLMIMSSFAVTVFAEDSAGIETYYSQDFQAYDVSNGGGSYKGYEPWIADDGEQFSAPKGSQACWDGTWEIKVAVYSEDNTPNKYLRVGHNTTLTMKNAAFDAYLEEAAALGADSYHLRYDIKFENPDAESHANLTWRTSSADHMSIVFEGGTVWYKLHHNTSGTPTNMIDSGIEYATDTWYPFEYFYENGKVSVLFNNEIVYSGDDTYSTFMESVWNDNVYYITAPSNTALGIDNVEISAHQSHNYDTGFDKISLCDNALNVKGAVFPAGKVKLTLNLEDPNAEVIYTKNLVTNADGTFEDDIVIDTPAETGDYKLVTVMHPVFTGTNTEHTFSVFSSTDRSSKLNFTSEDGETTEGIIFADLFFYDIDVEDGSLYDSLVDKAPVFNALAGNSYSNVEAFKNAFMYAATFQSMRETTDADILVNTLEDNKAVFGLDLSGAFAEYGSAICALIIEYVEDIEDAEDLAAFIRKGEVYFELVNASRTKILETVEAYEEELLSYGLDEDFEDGTAKKRKNAALEILEVEFNDDEIFDLNDRMDEIIDAMNDGFNKKTTTSSSKGSGGGGGASFRPVSITTPAVPEEEEPKADVPVPDVSKTEEPKAEVPDANFDDVSKEHWAHKAISDIKNKGIMIGNNGKFRPDDKIKREEFAKIVVEAFEIAANDSEMTFKDVNDDAWYNGYIKAAFTNGLINGQSSEVFGVGKEITRQDVAVILYRYLADKLDTIEKETVDFEDAAEISPYAVDAAKFMKQHKLMVGDNGKFNPNQPLTRAMAAQLIYNIISAQ